MKACPYCKELVKDEAVKCRYCQSMLDEDVVASDDDKVTYIVDRDLIRFGKFASAFLALFAAVGLFAFGYDVEKTTERLDETQRQNVALQSELNTHQGNLAEAANELATARAEVAALQEDLDDRQADLELATNELANVQADMDSTRAEMTDTLKSLIHTRVTITTSARVISTSVKQAREYLSIIAEQADRSRRLTAAQEESLEARRHENPGKFRTSPDTNLWNVGTTITVSFLDGEISLHNKVQEYAQEWSRYANITFAFNETSDADADIRISFLPTGNWSYVGVDSLAIADGDPTMNLHLEPTWSDQEIARAVLHEFGHVLGLLHEEQNPNADIPWDIDAVYEYYGNSPYHWPEQQINRLILSTWDPNPFPEKEFDPQSIMIYLTIPNEVTIGDYELTPQSTLSSNDKAFIALLYPSDE